MDHGLITSLCLGLFLDLSSFVKNHSLYAIVSDRLSAVFVFMFLSFTGHLLQPGPITSERRPHKQTHLSSVICEAIVLVRPKAVSEHIYERCTALSSVPHLTTRTTAIGF